MVLVFDSMATSSKISVEMRSDGFGASLYGSVNSTVKKVEKINSALTFSSMVKTTEKSAEHSQGSPVGDEFDRLPTTIKKDCQVRAKVYEQEVSDLENILEGNKSNL